MNAAIMMIWCRALALLLLLTPPLLHAVELTGRFSMLGTTASAEAGDIGYQGAAGDVLTADQQSARLMFDDVLQQSEWSIHLKTVRQHLSGYPVGEFHSSDLFRYRRGGGFLLDEEGSDTATTIEYELDRLLYRHRYDHATFSIGRQALDWGSGRFWQPLNVFGAFAPTDLDTDYKPGIDALTVDAYPSEFSLLTGVYVPAPEDEPEIDNSGALHYRSQVGELSELSLLAGSVIGNRVFGGAFESAWGGMGLRLEGVHYTLNENDEQAVFWIAGIDYQFEDGTLIAAEWYDNSRGATKQTELQEMADDPLVLYGLQPHLSRQVLGMMVEKDITPLLQGGYTLLASYLRDNDDKRHISLLHQLNLIYSVSNESDLLMSLLYGNGQGLDSKEQPGSEFGHIPMAITLRLRFYF